MTRPRLLIVEDEIIIALDLKAQLQRLGYDVIGLAANGDEALQLAEAQRPDLVLMDLVLRGPVDGAQTADQLRERYGLPVVFITAYSDAATLERVRVTEPYGYILKPFDTRQLHSLVEIALYKHRAEQKLRDSEAQFRALFETASDAIVLADGAGLIIGWNAGAEALFQYSASEIVGQPLTCLMPEPYAAAHTRALLDATHHQRAPRRRTMETTARAKDGAVFPIELTLSGWEKNGQNNYGAIIRNIAQRKQVEAELTALNSRLAEAAHAAQAAIRLRNQILANTSHELRTPLTAVIGALSIVLDGLCDSREDERSFLLSAQQAAQNLLEVINNLLLQAKIETNRLDMARGVVDLAPVLAEVETSLRPLAEEKRLALTVEALTPQQWKVWADPEWVRHILFNLVSNAIKFTERGQVTVRLAALETSASQIDLCVHDTGIGVAPEHQAQLFEPFVQEDGSPTRLYGGAGLGLSVSRYMAERLGGQLTLHSAGRGRGSTLTLTLPRAV